MVRWALVCLVLAFIAGLMGIFVVAGALASIAKLLFGLLLMLCIALFVTGLFLGDRSP